MKLFSFSSRCRWVLGFFALGGCVSGGNSSLSTVTDALEGESFKITGIDRHPINPEIVLTLAKKV